MSATIYARVPTDLKEAVGMYAQSAGMSLAGAVSVLLTRGLRSLHEEPDVLTRLGTLEVLVSTLLRERPSQGGDMYAVLRDVHSATGPVATS